jgi:hypothetical protein
MDEKPKSIWEKSWGRNWLGSLLLALAGSTVITAIGKLTGQFPSEAVDWITLILVLWPLIAFIRWLCCWRNFKKFAFAVVCLVTLVALVGAEETWRGKRALEKFKQEWSARGEIFDFKTFVPAVPDDQNFALTPVVASSYEYFFDRSGHEVMPRNTNVVDRLTMLSWRDSQKIKEPRGQDWHLAEKTDLKDWQIFFRSVPTSDTPLTTNINRFPMTAQPQSPPEDVLLALTKYDAALEELRAAAPLPESRFPLTYDAENSLMIVLPHLAALKSCSRVLHLRAAAELELDRSESALADVKLARRLMDSLRSDPVLISHLVRLALLQLLLQPVYEGLAEHRWTDAQLQALESLLAHLDLLADYQYALRGERIFGITGLDYLRRSRDLGAFDNPNGKPTSAPLKLLFRFLMPDGFFYQNELTMARLHQQFTLPMVNVTNGTVSPRKIRELQKSADAELLGNWSPYKIFARMLFPAVEKSAEKFVQAQSAVGLARTAIALERFRLAHGNFPDSLDALAPQFIEKVPRDVIGGGPLKYRREAGGSFTLYSVGWNETDDGGAVVLAKGETPGVDHHQGDWVWRYPK